MRFLLGLMLVFVLGTACSCGECKADDPAVISGIDYKFNVGEHVKNKLSTDQYIILEQSVTCEGLPYYVVKDKNGDEEDMEEVMLEKKK